MTEQIGAVGDNGPSVSSAVKETKVEDPNTSVVEVDGQNGTIAATESAPTHKNNESGKKRKRGKKKHGNIVAPPPPIDFIDMMVANIKREVEDGQQGQVSVADTSQVNTLE